MPHTTGLTEFCAIIKDTAIASAPAVQLLGEMVEKLGEETGLKGVEIFGEAIEQIARMTLQSSDLTRDNNIDIVDQNGWRGINDQVLAYKVYKRVRDAAVIKGA